MAKLPPIDKEQGKTYQADTCGPLVRGVKAGAVRLNELFVLVLEMFRHQHVALDELLSTTRRTVELFLADLSRPTKPPT